MKVLINTSIGGFSTTKEVFDRLIELGHAGALEEKEVIDEIKLDGGPFEYYSLCYIDRHDPVLLQVVEEIGIENAGSDHCVMKMVEIPDYTKYGIMENEAGIEHVYEEHTTWY